MKLIDSIYFVFCTISLLLLLLCDNVNGAPPERCCCITVEGEPCMEQQVKFCVERDGNRCAGDTEEPSFPPSLSVNPSSNPTSTRPISPSPSLSIQPSTTPTSSSNPSPSPAGMKIFGVWHCGNNYCDWTRVRTTTNGDEFDIANRWLIDRTYPDPASTCNPDIPYSCNPSVNLVILAFLEPQKLLDDLTDFGWSNGVPKGMTTDVVDYFKNQGIKVMVSMGGATYTDEWDDIVGNPANDYADAKTLAAKAYNVVSNLGLDGLEIDYEQGTPTREQLEGVEAFIDEYRSIELYSGLLTMDLAVGNQYLTDLSRLASGPATGFECATEPSHKTIGLGGWLENGKLDYINAMVPQKEPQTTQWQQHLDGMDNYSPKVPPKPASKVAVSEWLIKGKQVHPNCDDFYNSPMYDHSTYVLDNGLLGYMFWAVESTSPRRITTTPSGKTCEDGMGIAADYFNFMFPMPDYF